MVRVSKVVSVVALWLAGVSSAARPDTINFEDGAALGGQTIGNYYGGIGVTFNNAIWVTPAFTGFGNNEFWDGDAGLGVQNGVQNPNPWAFAGTTSPILISFSGDVSSVSIDVFDVGTNGARLRAFDVMGNLLGSDQALGTGAGFFNNATLSVNQPGMRSIALDQYNYSGFPDGIGWDNLQFTPAAAAVPEPASLASLTAGLAALAVWRNARRRASFQRRMLAKPATNYGPSTEQVGSAL